ncbi:hypothetical protein N7522_004057 [Penicillium canescens]|nr:hypothetical protein N7522_004057 [Penicillium canescens]
MKFSSTLIFLALAGASLGIPVGDPEGSGSIVVRQAPIDSSKAELLAEPINTATSTTDPDVPPPANDDCSRARQANPTASTKDALALANQKIPAARAPNSR